MPTKESPIWAIICLVVAVIALSLSPILTRVSENELGACATIFNRFWITSLALILGNGIKILWDKKNDCLSPRTQENYTFRDFFYLSILAIVESACVVTWAWSLTKTTVANSNLLHNTTPIFAVFGGWLLLNQSFNRRFLIGMTLALGGTAIVGIQDFQVDRYTLIGDSVALLSAIFYAGALMLIEHFRVKFTTATILTWTFSLSCLVLLPCTLLLEDRLLPVSGSVWFAVIALGLFCTLIGFGAVSYSLKQFSSSFVSLILLLEPIIAAFLAWIFFAEGLSLLNGVAFVVVLSGIYLAKSDEDEELEETPGTLNGSLEEGFL